ncbi:hypothetical protein ACIRS1_30940 [Kitasatospora sp. NPDC101176]|uniref:hypothetical protein n=1 Tax=Kitasatospora sp. NPDC101176 TaxID=3364099 RepID=UPI00382DCDE6
MSDQDEQAEQGVGDVTVAAPLTGGAPAPVPHPVPPPDDEWLLPDGFAHVFHAEGRSVLTRPVIMADGFNLGRSDLRWLYAGLDRDYPLLSRLRRGGRDVVLLGFEERSASLLDNARAAAACIRRACAESLGDGALTVGGFSMGGLVTRHALARLEHEGVDHRTALYFSYDSPHRGAVVPVGLQAFAHFIPVPAAFNRFARQMDSPAARQMLWRHYDPRTGRIGVAPERTAFLAESERVGGWPRIPRRIALANGRGDGTGLDVTPGDVAMTLHRIYPGTTFRAQAQGEGTVVAELRRRFPRAERTVTTDGFPELDGAPGGTLRSYGILADALRKLGAAVDLRHEHVCFVPAVSAVSIRDLDDNQDLYADIGALAPDGSDFDEFVCSSENTGHTTITGELCDWLLDRLPDGP